MTPIAAPSPNSYHANRTLLVLFLSLGAIFSLLWDLPGFHREQLGEWLSEESAVLGLGWLSAFLERVIDDWFKIGMLSVLLILSVFGLLQWMGVRRDRRCLMGAAAGKWECSPAWPRSRWVAAISSRPASLYRYFLRSDVLTLHFGFGRAHLLEPLRLALWGFPVVGFIGTVIGVSQAVKDLPTAMKDEAALGGVLSSLHLAFDTTFLGLLASVLVMLQLYLIEAIWSANEEVARNFNVQVRS